VPNYSRAGSGPDIVIAGAARSGTSLLASQLSMHPDIDPGSVKEPNYFSRRADRDDTWYEGLYKPRRAGLLRLDASVSYTYPQYPDALESLAETSPNVFVVYLVRDPVPRAISHFLFYRHYFTYRESAADFGAALRASSYYTDVSDYQRWRQALTAAFPDDRLLVVPFQAVTRSTHQVASVICSRLGLSAPPEMPDQVNAHRNNTVEFRHESARRISRALRQSRLYPRVRATIGAQGMRRIRSVLTRTPELPDEQAVLASCDDDQRAQLDALRDRARQAASDWLTEQDTREQYGWSQLWTFAD
jgi:hypothetical protein